MIHTNILNNFSTTTPTIRRIAYYYSSLGLNISSVFSIGEGNISNYYIRDRFESVIVLSKATDYETLASLEKTILD